MAFKCLLVKLVPRVRVGDLGNQHRPARWKSGGQCSPLELSERSGATAPSPGLPTCFMGHPSGQWPTHSTGIRFGKALCPLLLRGLGSGLSVPWKQA